MQSVLCMLLSILGNTQIPQKGMNHNTKERLDTHEWPWVACEHSNADSGMHIYTVEPVLLYPI